MQNETNYTITGEHAVRLAKRDNLTLLGDAITVRPVGWTGNADGANVSDYFRGDEYLGPDADGLEPVWDDAPTTEYDINCSRTGEILATVWAFDADVARIENLSSDTAEGHMLASSLCSQVDCCKHLAEELGERRVYLTIG